MRSLIMAAQQQARVSWGYTDAQIQALIAAGYIPVGNADDLDAVRSDQVNRDWATGTKWAVTLSSTGLTDSYIQVADIIHLTYNPAATTVFKVNYDGAGHLIQIGNSSLFPYIQEANIRNVCVIVDIITAGAWVGGLTRRFNSGTSECILNNCLTIGNLSNSNHQTGGMVGGRNAAYGHTINNCIACISVQISVINFNRFGGLVGWNDANINNSYSLGWVNAPSGTTGGLIGDRGGKTITSCLYNSETSGRSDNDGRGVPKTTAEMITGIPSAGIYTNWDLEIDAVTGKPVWVFENGLYPYLSIFGKMGASYPPPTSLDSLVSGGDINLTWTAPAIAPIGYNVYVSKDYGAWTKINPALLTVTNFSYTHTGVGAYNFFVKAVYAIRGFDQETGNSVTHLRTIS